MAIGWCLLVGAIRTEAFGFLLGAWDGPFRCLFARLKRFAQPGKSLAGLFSVRLGIDLVLNRGAHGCGG